MPKKIASRRREPRGTRPYMPGYGISTTKKSMLPWKWAEDRLRKSRQYWMVTVRPDGRPHVMPVWGLWRDDGFYFSTGGGSRKSRNLAAHTYCLVCNEDAQQVAMRQHSARVRREESRNRVS